MRPGAKILDYGCGYGRLAAELREAGFRNVTGIDPASAMIARGRELFADLDLRHVMVQYAGPYGVEYKLKALDWWAYWEQGNPRPAP